MSEDTHEVPLEYTTDGQIAPAQGIVLVTDVVALVDPGDTAALNRLLDTGNMNRVFPGQASDWYILSREQTAAAIHSLLHPLWSGYAHYVSADMSFNLTVRYYFNQYHPLPQWSYGSPVTKNTGVVHVFGAEYWADLEGAEATKLQRFMQAELQLHYAFGRITTLDDLEAALRHGMYTGNSNFEHLVMVRPDLNNGYAVQRFEVREAD